MPENPLVTMARRLSDLEAIVRRQRAVQSGYSLGDVFGSFLMLPQLRAFWPFSSTNENGQVYDLSGQGRVLSRNNAVGQGALATGMPYATYSGTAQWLTRADEAGLDVATNITLGGWFYMDTLQTAGAVTKYNATGNQRSFLLRPTVAGTVQFYISADGINNVLVTSTNTYQAATWVFIVGRLVVNQTQVIFLNNIGTTLSVGVPAGIFNSTAPLNLGAWATGTEPLTGRSALCFICATSVSANQISRLYHMSRPFFGV